MQKLRLLDAAVVKNAKLDKKRQKSVFGGYNSYLYCTITWLIGVTESGLCGYYSQDDCCEKAKEKYPPDFGPITSCVCY